MNPSTRDLITIEDLAAGLSSRFRFCGQTRVPYTVAQHSVEVSYHFPESGNLALWGLLHDAAEAYLPDVPRPLKPLLHFVVPNDDGRSGFRMLSIADVERAILWEVAAKWGLTMICDFPAAVRDADDAELLREVRDLCGGGDGWSDLPDGPVVRELVRPEEITPIEPAAAEKLFLARFEELTNKKD